MCQAAAWAVSRNERATLSIVWPKSATGMSSSGTNNASWEMTFTEMSTLPVCAAMESTQPLTAVSSRASTIAVSARPPARRMSPATASSLLGVRPARTTLAPSAAKARAIAPPMAPPPP